MGASVSLRLSSSTQNGIEPFKVIDIGSDGRTESSKFYLAELAALKETKTPKITLKMFSSGEIISAMRARLKAAC